MSRNTPHLSDAEKLVIRRMFGAGAHINAVHRETGRSFGTLARIRREMTE